MGGFDTKQKLLLGGALLLCALMWWSLAADEPMSAQMPPVAPKAVGAKTILGAELADKKLPMKNPFSALHENRVADSSDQQAPAAVKPIAVAAPVPAPLAPTPAAQATPTVALELTGIASSPAGRLALIRIGDRSYCVGVGETVESYKIIAINERSCLLQSSAGEQTLYLP